MNRIRLSDFIKRFPSFPHYRPGVEYDGKLILPYSIFDRGGSDPLIFYMDARDNFPEFQLIAYRDVYSEDSKTCIAIAKIPQHFGSPPHLTLVIR